MSVFDSKQHKKKWFNPLSEFDEESPKRKCPETNSIPVAPAMSPQKCSNKTSFNVSNKNWMRNFDPVTIEDVAVNNKKVQEVEQWLKSVSEGNHGDMLLLTGPVGCGKTIMVQTLAKKLNYRITEWITPMDIDIPTEYGDYEFREKQSTKFQDFIISAANFTSLLDNNSRKLVLVEDFPNTFTRTPSEFTQILARYRQRAKSPIVFICSEVHTDNKNGVLNLFTPQLKEQFQIHHVSLNSVTATGLKSALKRVSDIITRKYSSVYKTPTPDLIECVVNSSAGDVRSAVLNLHFACLKGSNQSLETSKFMEKDKSKSKTAKKKQPSSKFMSLGKDQTVSILHGVGRVLNPKVIVEGGKERLTHPPADVIEQFLSQPTSFVNFLEENYLPHYSSIEHAQRAASALSDADYMLAEWRERVCQEYGLYVATAGLMLTNQAPVSAWNPVRGPKNMRVQYPLNSVTATGLKSALKRVSDIITRKYSSVYKTPTPDLIECVVNSSAGDVRSAVLNLHFACLKGSNQSLETSKFMEKDKSKSKTAKKKQPSSKFMSLGKDQTVSILHGVGRVLNPKVIVEGGKERLTHPPADVIEQFLSQPTSFVNFLEENYLPHYSSIEHAQRAASALSDADYMLAEWRERVCQEYGLYVATAGLMLTNQAPVSAWNPVRGPKNMRVQYPTISDIPLLDPDLLYKGKVLVSDYKTYCKIINSNRT